MKNPNIKTEVKHSVNNSAWNVVGTKLGGKYKIARVPYIMYEFSDYDSNEACDILTKWMTNFNNGGYDHLLVTV